MAVTANFGWKKPADREQLLELLLQQILDEIDADLAAAAKPTTWTAPTLLNSWQNYGGAYRVAQYRKVGDRVEVRGFVKLGTLPGVIFTLPSGFRPTEKEQYNTTANNAAAGIEVDTSGNVRAIYGSNAYFAVNFSFSVL